MNLNKKAQLAVLYSSPIILIIVGGIIGYYFASSLGKDSSLGIVVGGALGLLLSRWVRF
jgi:uncharacterized membrane protein (UPF0136 family)